MFPSPQDYQKAVQIKNAGFFKKLFISKEKKFWADDIINWKLIEDNKLAEEKAKKKLEESIKLNLRNYQSKPIEKTIERTVNRTTDNNYNPNIYPYSQISGQTTDDTALNLVAAACILNSFSSSSSDSSDSSDSYSSSSSCSD